MTKIEKGAFYNCRNLKGITIPDSVTEIGEGAFSNCQSLINITIPNGITKINEKTFEMCYNLTDVIIPESVIEIGEYAFDRCIKLENITLPKNISKIGFAAIDMFNIKNINVYSYKVFSLLEETIKTIAIISTIKNYYTGKIQYNNEDMNLFREYIRKNKVIIFNNIKENKEIIHAILFEMDNFLTPNDIDELLCENIDAEINAMLIEYSYKIRNENINPLDEDDLGNFGTDIYEDNKQKRI